ncbi:MAG: SCO family protein, partial [Acidobacteria bacterium]|nr:SCO family protein [Acidobacteriota bacterium]
MRKLLFFLVSILFIAGCQTAKTGDSDPSKLKRFDLKGKIVSVDKAGGKVAIDHDEIPGYMSAMTMDFPVRDQVILNDLKPGSLIRAELVVDNPNGKFWLDNIVTTSAPGPGDAPLPVKEEVAVEGKPMIDFSLIDQDNKPVSLKDFAGKSWALTFIYSECPLPDFCIAMSKHFSDAANKIAENEELKQNTRLLSISFDPKRDTPERLKSYGLGYLGKDSKAADFSIWKLAAGKDEEIRKIADF